VTQFLLLLLLVPPAASRMRATEAESRVTGRTSGPLARAIAPAPATSAGRREPVPEPLTPAATRKAELLLRDHLPCLGCHTLNGSGGKVGPDLTTVRTRRSADYVAAIVADPARVVPAAAMPRTLMLPATRDLIIRYLQTRPGNAAGGVPAPRRPPYPPLPPLRTARRSTPGGAPAAMEPRDRATAPTPLPSPSNRRRTPTRRRCLSAPTTRCTTPSPAAVRS